MHEHPVLFKPGVVSPQDRLARGATSVLRAVDMVVRHHVLRVPLSRERLLEILMGRDYSACSSCGETVIGEPSAMVRWAGGVWLRKAQDGP